MALRLTGNRRYPAFPSVGVTVDEHTHFLQIAKEALEISQRRTADVLNSHVRVQDLIDLGLITIEGNTTAIVGADLSQIANIGDLTGAAEGDFLRFRSGEWINDDLSNTDITQVMVTQHQAALSIAYSQLTGTPSIPSDLDDLTDVDLSTPPVLGDVLTFDGSVWVAEASSGGGGGGGGGAVSLDDLDDVFVYLPARGDYLVWDGYGWTNSSSPQLAPLEYEILSDSPMAYWKCDESAGSTLVDSSGNGYNLTRVGTTTLQFSYLIPGDDSKYLHIASGANGASRAGTLGFTAPVQGDWTIEAVLIPHALTTGGVFLVGISGSGEAEAANYQLRVFLTEVGFSVFWEFGAGTNLSVNSSVGIQEGVPVHAACRKNGTANTIEFFLNGNRVSEVSYANEPTGGTDGSMITTLGYDGTANTDPMVVGHVAVYSTQLSDERIRAHAKAAGLA